MGSPIFLDAVTTACQKTSPAGAAVGFVIIFVVIGGFIALAVANSNARTRLAAANAELNFLRPENLMLRQQVASIAGAPVHEAYTGGAPTAPPPAGSWHPDPSGRHELRWWDGTKWTDQVSDKGVSSTESIDR